MTSLKSKHKQARQEVQDYDFGEPKSYSTDFRSTRRRTKYRKISKKVKKSDHVVDKQAGYSSPTDAALAMVDAYYCDPNPKVRARSVAAAALYAASLMFTEPDRQAVIAYELNVNPRTIQRHYSELLEIIGL
ncbi:MAG: hypothetical protein J07AB43_02310 [Candidatus Nanosalina sp. J07AB43]|jgi:Transcription initiation factor TFIIIB, Brf1 subunit/Transcription initiation factor TFIIB|nr:MAG: hypothetical protein J07AB43_02310 [Candidatus Nanosalina sp. J07AB43]